MQIIEIDNKWLDKIEIPREGEIVEGFQRKLSQDRVRDISKYMSNGHMMPPIFVGKIGERYICIDGQHRLEARKLKEFPLYAVIQETDYETAKDEFETINTMGTKVPLYHRLKITNKPVGKFVRKIAASYRIDMRQVFAIIKGLSGNWTPLIKYREHLPIEVKDKVTKILDIWTSDKRWKSKNGVFSKPGTLCVIGSICKDKSTIKNVLDKMLTLNYSKGSMLQQKYGAGGTSLKYMREYIIKMLFKRMDE